MLKHIRTTIDIPDALLARARRRAHAEGRTLRSVVTEALSNALDARHLPRDGLELPTYGGSGLAPDVEEQDLFAREERDLGSSWQGGPPAGQ